MSNRLHHPKDFLPPSLCTYRSICMEGSRIADDIRMGTAGFSDGSGWEVAVYSSGKGFYNGSGNGTGVLEFPIGQSLNYGVGSPASAGSSDGSGGLAASAYREIQVYYRTCICGEGVVIYASMPVDISFDDLLMEVVRGAV